MVMVGILLGCLRPDCSGPSCDYADRTEIVRAVGLLRRRGVVAVRSIELSSVAAAPADDRRTWGRGMARACALCELCAHKKTPVSLGDCRGAVVDRAGHQGITVVLMGSLQKSSFEISPNVMTSARGSIHR